MTTPEPTVTTDVWLVLEPRRHWGRGRPTSVSDVGGMGVVGHRKTEPSLEAGQRAIRVRLVVPASAFMDPPSMQATVEFGSEQIVEPKVEALPSPDEPEADG